MFTNPWNVFNLVVGSSAFGLVLSLAVWLALFRKARSHARNELVQRRVGVPDLERQSLSMATRTLRLWHEGAVATTEVPAWSWRGKFWARLEHLSRDAGLHVPVRALLSGVVAAAGLAVGVAFLLTKNLLLSSVAGAAVLLAAYILLNHRIMQQAGLFDRQLADALQLASRSLRAGHTLANAFQLASQELSEPIAGVFGDICKRQQVGSSMEEALDRVGSEFASTDMRLFVTSVTIQLRSGGNLADLMDRLAMVIRDRIQLNRRVRVLTAQTQFSKNVLVVLPFLLFVLLNAINPRYMHELYLTSAGQLMLTVAAALLVLGIWMMNRMAALR